MGKATKILLETEKFLFVKQTNQKDKSHYYTIRVVAWRMNGKNVIDDMRDLFDPGRNRGGKYAMTWKFKNRKTAEQLLTLAILKWGE